LAQGSASLQQVLLETPAILEEDVTGGDGFDSIEILTIDPGEKIELKGSFEEVLIDSNAPEAKKILKIELD